MSYGPRGAYDYRSEGIFRDRDNGWIFGVCAGLADYFGIRVGVVRIIAALSLCLFFWPTAIAYIAATLMIRERPLIYRGRAPEYDFWRRGGYDNRWSHR